MNTTTRSAVMAYEAVRDHEAVQRDAHEFVDLQPGDAYPQGDVIIARIDVAPSHVDKWSHGTQLAEGTTQGSRHFAEGDVQLFTPNAVEVNGVIDRLFPRSKGNPRILGPCVLAASPWTATHPEHGDRTFPPGEYQVLYQRAASVELSRAKD